MDAQIVGKGIAKLRKSHKMTQKQLADELSVTYKAVSKWETGTGLPDIAMLPALASVFNVSIDEIVSGSSSDDNVKNNQSNIHSRAIVIRRYVRKSAAIIMSFLVVALVAFLIMLSNRKESVILVFDDGISVPLAEASGFGVSADHAKAIYDMQLADNIKTQLLQSCHIDDAVVLVDTAEASPFRIQENESETKVSVILTLAETYKFSDIDLHAIENLIKSSVPNIKDLNISIT